MNMLARGRLFEVEHAAETNPNERNQLFAALQRMLATDSVNAYLFNQAQVAVAKKGFRGLWANLPILANELAAMAWQ